MTGTGERTIAEDSDNRSNSLVMGNILNDNESDGDYWRIGNSYSEVATTIDGKQSQPD